MKRWIIINKALKNAWIDTDNKEDFHFRFVCEDGSDCCVNYEDITTDDQLVYCFCEFMNQPTKVYMFTLTEHIKQKLHNYENKRFNKR